MVEFDNIKIRDQLGRPEDKNITIKRKTETVFIESNTLSLLKRSLGNSWIAGSSTNGLVGTNTSTEGGGQQVVGASGRTDVVKAIVNPNKLYREHFTTTYFKGAATTADWADTAEELSFTTGEVAASNSIAFADGTVITATLSVVVKSGSSSDLTLRMRADGSTWENATIGTQHIFTVTGTNLQWELTSSGTVVLSQLQIQYN